MRCLNCGNEVKQHDGKRHKLYCNEACRKAYQRKTKVWPGTEKVMEMKPYPDTNTGQTITGQAGIAQAKQDEQVARMRMNVAEVEGGKCWCCGADLDHPKQVCCGPCAWSGKAKAKRDGRYPPLLTDRTPEQMERDFHSPILTGGYGLTDTEQANYKPADQLGKGEHKLVSKPGDADYDGVGT